VTYFSHLLLLLQPHSLLSWEQMQLWQQKLPKVEETLPWNDRASFHFVIVCMEAFGLNSHIKEVCDRLAKAGYAALAPDFYHGATYI
jgi:hypothetical protein